MHPKFQRADELSHLVIGGEIEVHRLKSPGLLESIYEKCLMQELSLRNIDACQQVVVPIEYKGLVFEESLKVDILVENCLILELKAINEVLPIHKAQLLSYRKLMDAPLGLLINFHELRLVEGLHRRILPDADKPSVQDPSEKGAIRHEPIIFFAHFASFCSKSHVMHPPDAGRPCPVAIRSKRFLVVASPAGPQFAERTTRIATSRTRIDLRGTTPLSSGR